MIGQFYRTNFVIKNVFKFIEKTSKYTKKTEIVFKLQKI